MQVLQDFGVFSLYTNKNDRTGYVFIQNEAEQDFYHLRDVLAQHDADVPVSYLVINPDTGIVQAAHSNIAMVFPKNSHLVSIDYTENPALYLGYRLQGDQIVPPNTPRMTTVTRAQAKLALLQAGLLDIVDGAVAQADRATQIWYADANVWERDNPAIATLGAALNLSSDQIDALFASAARL